MFCMGFKRHTYICIVLCPINDEKHNLCISYWYALFSYLTDHLFRYNNIWTCIYIYLFVCTLEANIPLPEVYRISEMYYVTCQYSSLHLAKGHLHYYCRKEHFSQYQLWARRELLTEATVTVGAPVSITLLKCCGRRQ